MRSGFARYLSPLGAGTLEQISIRPAVLTNKVNRLIAVLADKRNLSVISMMVMVVRPGMVKPEIIVPIGVRVVGITIFCSSPP